LLAPTLRDRAVAAACTIAERLRSPEVVRAGVEAMRWQKRAPGDPSGALSPWGIARRARLFLALRDAVDERGWEEPAHRHLRLAAETSHQAPLTRPALFGGTAGFALVVESFLRAEPRYRPVRDALLEQLAEQVLGHRLSGGERQRLAIARLLLKAPSIVVLDEATAHLDAESERAVQQALDGVLAGRTCLVIAHRLSTIRGCDEILVVEGGRIVERGGHDELLEAGGPYARAHRAQSSTAVTSA
jgi:hypothetical protein